MAKKVHVGARIDPELHETITEAANAQGITISEQVNHLLTIGQQAMSPEDIRELIREELGQRSHPSSLPVHEEEGKEEYDHYDILPDNTLEELYYLLEEAAERSDEDTSVVDFFNQLAEEAEDHLALPDDHDYRADELPELPTHLAEAFDDILDVVLGEFEDQEELAREEFLEVLGHVLREAASQYYEQSRQIMLRFEPEAWEQLDLLLTRVNRRRDEEEQFTNLKSYLLWLLGKDLKDKAGELLFGGYERPAMGELGKVLQQRGLK